MARRRKTRNRSTVAPKKKIIPETKYKLETLKNADEFSEHADLLSALFISQEYLTKSEARNAIKQHLEREV